MKAVLPLFLFIDACGWEIIKDDPFCNSVAPNRRRLDSVFGYSSACVPSILSGRWPDEHRNWCYFVYDPKHSPFKVLKPLQWLPKAITSRRIVRRWLSKLVKVQLKFRGYFDLYNIPFKHISLFDFTEKKSPLRPSGMNRGTNISDFLATSGIAHHVSDPTRSETENLDAVLADVKTGRIDFAFVYWPDLDGLLHRAGNQSPEISPKLRGYEERISRLLEAAQEQYEEVRLYVFSDHGMANCDSLLDLKARIEPLPLEFGKDYAVVYDSTMARFWFFNKRARFLVTEALRTIPEGRIVPDAELERLHCLFPDRYFGELIFLMREGVLIVPSHMGERPIRAMHGYHPEEKHSYAALLTNQPEIPDDVTAIPHLYILMVRDALIAHEQNQSPGPPKRREGKSAPVSRDVSEPVLAVSARVSVPNFEQE
ncbi:MAG: alkaline phosphatase family protein [Verrucomicrobia bacterium]|nr:alkaline phosphatase family protein [Verrucomicrobiota bacterium]